MALQVVTANRLSDGAVVYLTGSGGWSEWLSDGQIASDSACESELLRIAERAVGLVPVDTGELRGSIAHQKMGSGWAVVASAPHAGYVEYGTSKMAAQPYLRPAAQGVDGESIAQAALARIGL